MPAMSPAEVVSQIQQDMLQRDPPLTRPSDILILLQRLRELTNTIKIDIVVAKTKGTLPGPTQASIDDSMTRWENLLTYYEQQTASAPQDDRDSIARTVTAPLLIGYCYGYPSCGSPGAVFEPSLAITPRAAEPFIIQHMLEVAEEAERQNSFLEALGGVMEERWEDIKEVAKDVVKAARRAGRNVVTPVLVGLGIVGGIAGLAWLTRRSRAA